MIVFFEGLSQLGKSYLINKLVEQNPDYIKFKGAGAINIGMKEHWQEYNYWMHNIIERLDQINDYKKVILWDRGLTDATYSEDENYRKEILRVSKSHISKCIVYIYASEKDFAILANNRNSKEGNDYKMHSEKYDKTISSFSTCILKLSKPDYFIEQSHINKVIGFINDKMKNE